MSISPIPTSDQTVLMDKEWSQTSVTEVDGIIGMYGQDNAYYFYHEFQPENDDEWWDGSVLEKNFRVIYQMGDTLSDWTGVTLNVSSTDTYSTDNAVQKVQLDKISMTNSIKTGGNSNILSDSRDNSTFDGYIHWYYGDDGTTAAPPTKCTVYIQRLIEREEQTETDGSVVRIETGRSLKGAYYQKDGTAISFTVELQGAMNSLVAAAGLVLASSVMLLTF